MRPGQHPHHAPWRPHRHSARTPAGVPDRRCIACTKTGPGRALPRSRRAGPCRAVRISVHPVPHRRARSPLPVPLGGRVQRHETAVRRRSSPPTKRSTPSRPTTRARGKSASSSTTTGRTSSARVSVSPSRGSPDQRCGRRAGKGQPVPDCPWLSLPGRHDARPLIKWHNARMRKAPHQGSGGGTPRHSPPAAALFCTS